MYETACAFRVFIVLQDLLTASAKTVTTLHVTALRVYVSIAETL